MRIRFGRCYCDVSASVAAEEIPLMTLRTSRCIHEHTDVSSSFDTSPHSSASGPYCVIQTYKAVLNTPMLLEPTLPSLPATAVLPCPSTLSFVLPFGVFLFYGHFNKAYKTHSGGGIAGLTLANALASPSIQVDVYEGAKQFGAIGAGIGFLEKTLCLMGSIGLEEELHKLAGHQIVGGERMYRSSGS
jgi:hypothetical protein